MRSIVDVKTMLPENSPAGTSFPPILVAGRELNINLGIASLTACEFGIGMCMYVRSSQNTH